MDFYENYCHTLERELNQLYKRNNELESKINSLERIIDLANKKLEEYYLNQKSNEYSNNQDQRLICEVIKDCQKIVNDVFEQRKM